MTSITYSYISLTIRQHTHARRKRLLS